MGLKGPGLKFDFLSKVKKGESSGLLEVSLARLDQAFSGLKPRINGKNLTSLE